MTFQLVNYGFSRWIANDTVGQTTFQTWSANLRHGFEWDNDHFPVNQLAHFNGPDLHQRHELIAGVPAQEILRSKLIRQQASHATKRGITCTVSERIVYLF